MDVALFDPSGGQIHERAGASVVQISLYVMAASYTLYYLLYGRALDQLCRTDNHLMGVPTELRVEDDGLYHSSTNCRSVITWSGLKVIDEVGCVLLLGLDKLHFLPIPTSVFESREEKDGFIAYLKEKRAAAAGEVVIPSANLPPPFFATTPNSVTAEFEPAEQHWSALKKNLFNALKLAFGGRVAPERLAISWWQAITFATLGLLPPLIYDLAANGIHAWQESRSAAAYCFAVIARLSRRTERRSGLLEHDQLVFYGPSVQHAPDQT